MLMTSTILLFYTKSIFSKNVKRFLYINFFFSEVKPSPPLRTPKQSLKNCCMKGMHKKSKIVLVLNTKPFWIERTLRWGQIFSDLKIIGVRWLLYFVSSIKGYVIQFWACYYEKPVWKMSKRSNKFVYFIL